MDKLIMTDSDRRVFDGNYLVYGLPDEAKDELAALCTIEESNPGSLIFVEDQQNSDLVVILKGTVSIVKGREKLGEAGPGSVVGEIALVDNRPHSAHVMPITPVLLARFDGPMLRRYMLQKSSVGFLMLANLSRVLAGRLRNLTDQYEDLKGEAREPWQLSRDRAPQRPA